ncbi:hypothetical protein H2200_011182 [Cladophialophora chaetospira]|uniref:TPR-like protein n=1 Tax=Cladophialophora chaetospira TaxID=386627 RepID=A0AA38X073_9EURO|nr:hypothetical protein H2200_011182 [Cladophialophora chaetospira]
MVVDPVSAVGLAANVVQFIESADGILEENALIEMTVNDLKDQLDRIKDVISSGWPSLARFQHESLKLASELLEALDKLKVKGSPGKWKSLRKALKSIHSKEKIADWLASLDRLRHDFYIHIEVEILEKVTLIDIPLSDAFQTLNQEQQRGIERFIDALRRGTDLLEEISIRQTAAISDLVKSEHENTQTKVHEAHMETRGAIRTESEATRDSIVRTAGETRELVVMEHEQTRTHISDEQEVTRLSLTSIVEASVLTAGAEHALTRAEVIESVNEQGVAAKLAIEEGLQRTADLMEVESFRTQLEHEWNLPSSPISAGQGFSALLNATAHTPVFRNHSNGLNVPMEGICHKMSSSSLRRYYQWQASRIYPPFDGGQQPTQLDNENHPHPNTRDTAGIVGEQSPTVDHGLASLSRPLDPRSNEKERYQCPYTNCEHRSFRNVGHFNNHMRDYHFELPHRNQHPSNFLIPDRSPRANILDVLQESPDDCTSSCGDPSSTLTKPNGGPTLSDTNNTTQPTPSYNPPTANNDVCGILEEPACVCHLPQSEKDSLFKASTSRFEACQSRSGDAHRQALTTLLDLAILTLCQKDFAAAATLCDKGLHLCNIQQPRLRVPGLQFRRIRANIHLSVGEFDAAEREIKDLLKESELTFGVVHTETIRVTLLRARLHRFRGEHEAAFDDYRFAFDQYVLQKGRNDDSTLDLRLWLGVSLRDQQHYEEAKRECQAVLDFRRQELGESHLDTLLAFSHLGSLYAAQEQYMTAEPHLVLALQGLELLLGPTHDLTLSAAESLGSVYSNLGRHEDARNLLSRVAREGERLIRQFNTIYLTSMSALIEVYRGEGNTLQALQTCEQLLSSMPSYRSYSSEAARLTISSLLGGLYHQAGRNYEATELLRRVLKDATELLGPHEATVIDTHVRLGNILWGQGNFADALQQYRSVVSSSEMKHGPASEKVMDWLEDFSNRCISAELWVDAIDLLQKLLTILEKTQGTWSDSTWKAMLHLGVALSNDKRFAAATETLSRAQYLAETKHGPHSRHVVLNIVEETKLLEKQHLYHQAEASWKKIMKMMEAKRECFKPEDFPEILELLGLNYMAQNRFGEAVIVLDRALTLLEQVWDFRRKDLAETFMNLVNAYRKLGLSEDSAELNALRVRLRKYK